MPTVFPGMNPHLESKTLWPSFHHLLADEIMAQLNASLSERYYADVEVRSILEGVGISSTQTIYPDAAVLQADPASGTQPETAAALVAPVQRVALSAEQSKLRSVQIHLADKKTLVTAIEILSPSKKQGYGLAQYRQKRERLLHSPVHLVEIDLLRAGSDFAYLAAGSKPAAPHTPHSSVAPR